MSPRLANRIPTVTPRTRAARITAALAASLIGVVLIGGGCAGDPMAGTPPAAAPARVARFVPPPDRFVRSNLLGFDAAGDAAFVAAPDVTLGTDPSRPGGRALVARDAVVKLGALVRGRDFPGPWDLVGVRVMSPRGGRCGVSLGRASTAHAGDATSRPAARPSPAGPSPADTSSAAIALAPGAWIDVWLELAPPDGSPPADTDALALSVRSLDATPLWIDDVSIAQSAIVVSASTVPESGQAWQVARRGLRWLALVDGREVFALPAAPFVEGGYRVVDAGPTRVLFTNDRGSSVGIDRTGRLIENGVARLDAGVRSFAKAIAENASPALVEAVGEEGRIERSLPGDADNDGYDESRGCYAVRALAGRARVRLTRQRSTVRWPVLEIYDLPPGPVSVWLAGQTVPWAARSADGRVSVELPIELVNPVEVQIRVK